MLYFYVTSGEDMKIMAKIKEYKPTGPSWFLCVQCIACRVKGQKFGQLTTIFTEDQQKETSSKRYSSADPSWCSLVTVRFVSNLEKRPFYVGFILPCYHPPNNTKQWVMQQSFLPVTCEKVVVLIFSLPRSTQISFSVDSLIFLSLSQHGFLFHSVLRHFVSKTRKGLNWRILAGYLC